MVRSCLPAIACHCIAAQILPSCSSLMFYSRLGILFQQLACRNATWKRGEGSAALCTRTSRVLTGCLVQHLSVYSVSAVVEGRLYLSGSISGNAMFSCPKGLALLCRYLMGSHTPKWQWLCFFTVQGPLIAAERACTKTLQHSKWDIHLPRWVSVLLSLCILLLTADWLFFSVWYGTAFADRVNAALRHDLQSLASFIH